MTDAATPTTGTTTTDQTSYVDPDTGQPYTGDSADPATDPATTDGDVPPADDGSANAADDTGDTTSHWYSSNTNSANNTNNTNSTNSSTYVYDDSQIVQEDRDALMTFEELAQAAQGDGEEALTARTKLQNLLQQQMTQVQQLAKQVAQEEQQFDSARKKSQKGEKASEQTKEKLVSKAALMERVVAQLQKSGGAAKGKEAQGFFNNLLSEDYQLVQTARDASQTAKKAQTNSQSAQAMRVSQRYARLLQLQQTGKLSTHQQKTMDRLAAQLKERMAKLGVTEFKAGDAASGKLARNMPRSQPAATPSTTIPDPTHTPTETRDTEGAERAEQENTAPPTTPQDVEVAGRGVIAHVGSEQAENNRRKHEKGRLSISGFISNLFKKKQTLLSAQAEGKKEEATLTGTESSAIALGAIVCFGRLTSGNPQELGIVILGGGRVEANELLGCEDSQAAPTGPTSPTSPTIDYDAARAFVANVERLENPFHNDADDRYGRTAHYVSVKERDPRVGDAVTAELSDERVAV